MLLLVTSAVGVAAADSTLRTLREFAARHEGDAVRGRELFRAEKTACAFCHSVDGTHSRAGPDLASVGDALGRRELIEALLEPNATIAVGYEATVVETNSGERTLGVVKAANDSWLEVMGPDGVRARFARQEIKSATPADRSLMPDGLHRSLSVQEFTDLIAYLVSLKQPATLSAAQRGAPDLIPAVKKRVALRPLLPDDQRFPFSVVRKPGETRLGLVWAGAIPGTRALLVAHQSGALTTIEERDGQKVKSPFADLAAGLYSRTGPNGLLGVAFHPQYPANRRYYLKHQVFEAGQIVTTVIERIAAPDLRRDSGAPSRRLIAIPCVTQNHTGGCLAFGPDGFLYIGMGDTGPQQDPNGHGQDLQLLLGKMLRIDVDRREDGLAYGIPSDNPFRTRADARPEIWALGFREPWRFSFDPATGDLWVGDVGQDRLEEIAVVRRGENHGWNVFEGFEPFSRARRSATATYIPPVVAYKRLYGNSVTGGFVYRGDPRSPFHGVYVFGDYTSKKIFGLRHQDRQLTLLREIGDSPESIASFGLEHDDNLLVVGYEGMIFQIDFSGAEFDGDLADSSSPAIPASRSRE